MAAHFPPIPPRDPNNIPPESTPPVVAHQRWMEHGTKLSFGYNKAPPESRGKHAHPEIKLAIIFDPVSGAYTSWKTAGGESRELRLTGRQVFCVGGGVPHAVRWDSDAPLIEVMPRRSFLTTITPEQINAVVARELLEGAAHDRVLWELAWKIRLLCSGPEQADVRLLEPMVTCLARRIFTCHDECYAPKPGPRLSEDRTQLVIDHMEDRIAEKIELDDLAALVSLSAPHFTELFRNRTGRPPIEFLRELRRIKAHDLVFSGEMRMSEIADAAGFCDEPHLNREFKKFFGYSAKFLRTRGQSAADSEKTAASS